MADLYKNFKSQTAIKAAQEENKKERQLILQIAKKQFEIRQAKEEKARRQGEGTWMLDSVSQRINQEEQALLKAKKASKKKKKRKKKKKKANRSSTSDSDSSEQEEKWVESSLATDKVSTGIMKGPKIQRDSWMEAPLEQLIPTTSRQEIRDAINKDKEKARRAAEKAQEPGQHSRELNPYWKDGGTGLPEEKVKEKKFEPLSSSSHAPSGDGGYSWLQKAYTRCVQQAEDEGRSLEDIAAERWGSLKKLKKMLAEAKQNVEESQGADSPSFRRREGSKPHRRERSGSRERYRDRSTSRERRRNRSRSKERDRSHSRERRDTQERRRDRSSSSERKSYRSRGCREEKRLSPTSKFRKPDSDDEYSSGRSSFKRSSEDNNGSTRSDRRFMRPTDSNVNLKRREESRSQRFMRPSDNKSTLSDSSRRKSSVSPNRGNTPRWKRKTEPEINRQVEEKHKQASLSKDDRGNHGGRKEPSSPSSSDSDESSSDQSNDDHPKSEEGSAQEAIKSTPKVLSEEELNDLAAKILRAEIMGDDDLAATLKSKLEAARQAREKSKSSTSRPDFSHQRRAESCGRRDRGDRDNDDQDNVVVLSRTNKSGMVRPVTGEQAERWGGTKPGKKRKKAVVTHDTSGMRTIYFDDDSKFDLKALVEQEKAGTAEDQNAMFSRLAGRASDRDLDIDDMFVSKAARKQNEEGAAARDRSAAIFEHKKISAAMEKCNRCFDKVPKHLIIAIGAKSYLCLPPHRSLTTGHCLIVPMQHVASCVAMDEDVWREMQLFRKSLVQMFKAQEEDMVIMETVMHLKHFPHTALECIPLEKETGDLAPIYFKKAIQEAGPEWSDNKKLHSLRDKDVRHVIPKGFPYFSVDFGLEGGYATVIEDEQTFPSYFGREIVGGMIDAEPALWRKPHKQSFEDQRQKVLKFEAMWRPFDFTQDLGAGD